jgi:hypothetical protein
MTSDTATSLPQTMDADVWAREFANRFHGRVVGDTIDIDLMRGWFANAIMAGFDTATNRARDAASADATNEIQALANRFLAWPLPASVRSDPVAMIPNTPHRTGTTLLTADEARQMFEHVLAGPLVAPTEATECICAEINARHCPVHNDPYVKEVGAWKIIQRLEEERDAYKKAYEAAKDRACGCIQASYDQIGKGYLAAEVLKEFEAQLDSILFQYEASGVKP